MLTARFQLTKKFSSAWLTLETSLQVLSIPGCGLAPWKYLSVSNRCSVQLNCAWESIWMIFILFVSLLSGVESTILNVSSGSEMSSKARQLGEHFRLHGTPVMIGILKSSILKRLFKLELQPGCNSNEKAPLELHQKLCRPIRIDPNSQMRNVDKLAYNVVDCIRSSVVVSRHLQSIPIPLHLGMWG